MKKQNRLTMRNDSIDIDCKTVDIFAYSRTREQSNKGLQRGWKERARLGRDGFFALASHALRACAARALRARKTLTPRFIDFFTDFEKKPIVLQSSIDRIILPFFFSLLLDSRLSLSQFIDGILSGIDFEGDV